LPNLVLLERESVCYTDLPTSLTPWQVWHFAYFPVSATRPFDRFGNRYNISRVINFATYSLNETAYEEYSELYLPSTYALTYFIAFAISTSILVHTALYHGPALLAGIKNVRVEEDDIHAKLMRHYPEVPDWWYLIVGAVFFALAMITALVRCIGFLTRRD
jgi:hypothetical protein